MTRKFNLTFPLESKLIIPKSIRTVETQTSVQLNEPINDRRETNAVQPTTSRNTNDGNEPTNDRAETNLVQPTTSRNTNNGEETFLNDHNTIASFEKSKMRWLNKNKKVPPKESDDEKTNDSDDESNERKRLRTSTDESNDSRLHYRDFVTLYRPKSSTPSRSNDEENNESNVSKSSVDHPKSSTPSTSNKRSHLGIKKPNSSSIVSHSIEKSKNIGITDKRLSQLVKSSSAIHSHSSIDKSKIDIAKPSDQLNEEDENDSSEFIFHLSDSDNVTDNQLNEASSSRLLGIFPSHSSILTRSNADLSTSSNLGLPILFKTPSKRKTTDKDVHVDKKKPRNQSLVNSDITMDSLPEDITDAVLLTPPNQLMSQMRDNRTGLTGKILHLKIAGSNEVSASGSGANKKMGKSTNLDQFRPNENARFNNDPDSSSSTNNSGASKNIGKATNPNQSRQKNNARFDNDPYRFDTDQDSNSSANIVFKNSEAKKKMGKSTNPNQFTENNNARIDIDPDSSSSTNNSGASKKIGKATNPNQYRDNNNARFDTDPDSSSSTNNSRANKNMGKATNPNQSRQKKNARFDNDPDSSSSTNNSGANKNMGKATNPNQQNKRNYKIFDTNSEESLEDSQSHTTRSTDNVDHMIPENDNYQNDYQMDDNDNEIDYEQMPNTSRDANHEQMPTTSRDANHRQMPTTSRDANSQKSRRKQREPKRYGYRSNINNFDDSKFIKTLPLERQKSVLKRLDDHLNTLMNPARNQGVRRSERIRLNQIERYRRRKMFVSYEITMNIRAQEMARLKDRMFNLSLRNVTERKKQNTSNRKKDNGKSNNGKQAKGDRRDLNEN